MGKGKGKDVKFLIKGKGKFFFVFFLIVFGLRFISSLIFEIIIKEWELILLLYF